MSEKSHKSIPIQIRLNEVAVEIIDDLVSKGLAKSRSNFCETAVMRRLEDLGVFEPAIRERMEKMEKEGD